jgi:sulfoxide reductase heme-binding subunit YedZ
MSWNLILPPLANIFGFIALILYFLTLQPGFFRVIHPIFLKNKFLSFVTRHRRKLGILAFLSALVHGVILSLEHQLNFFELETFQRYWPGISLISIFGILAFTSNEWSVRHLKQNWKKLHQITFLAMFVMLYHIFDKVKTWTYVTPVGIFMLGVAITLFTWKKLEERNKKK